MSQRRALCAYFWFCGWDHFSLGIHVCVCCPNIEIHVPFGFFRFGWKYYTPGSNCMNPHESDKRLFGYRGAAG